MIKIYFNLIKFKLTYLFFIILFKRLIICVYKWYMFFCTLILFVYIICFNLFDSTSIVNKCMRLYIFQHDLYYL